MFSFKTKVISECLPSFYSMLICKHLLTLRPCWHKSTYEVPTWDVYTAQLSITAFNFLKYLILQVLLVLTAAGKRLLVSSIRVNNQLEKLL